MPGVRTGRCPEGLYFSCKSLRLLRPGPESVRDGGFAPYLVTFAVGLICIPAALLISLQSGSEPRTAWLLLAAALALAAVLLPRAKGAAIGLLWALDVRS